MNNKNFPPPPPTPAAPDYADHTRRIPPHVIQQALGQQSPLHHQQPVEQQPVHIERTNVVPGDPSLGERSRSGEVRGVLTPADLAHVPTEREKQLAADDELADKLARQIAAREAAADARSEQSPSTPSPVVEADVTQRVPMSDPNPPKASSPNKASTSQPVPPRTGSRTAHQSPNPAPKPGSTSPKPQPAPQPKQPEAPEWPTSDEDANTPPATPNTPNTPPVAPEANAAPKRSARYQRIEKFTDAELLAIKGDLRNKHVAALTEDEQKLFRDRREAVLKKSPHHRLEDMMMFEYQHPNASGNTKYSSKQIHEFTNKINADLDRQKLDPNYKGVQLSKLQYDAVAHLHTAVRKRNPGAVDYEDPRIAITDLENGNVKLDNNEIRALNSEQVFTDGNGGQAVSSTLRGEELAHLNFDAKDPEGRQLFNSLPVDIQHKLNHYHANQHRGQQKEGTISPEGQKYLARLQALAHAQRIADDFSPHAHHDKDNRGISYTEVVNFTKYAHANNLLSAAEIEKLRGPYKEAQEALEYGQQLAGSRPLEEGVAQSPLEGTPTKLDEHGRPVEFYRVDDVLRQQGGTADRLLGNIQDVRAITQANTFGLEFHGMTNKQAQDALKHIERLYSMKGITQNQQNILGMTRMKLLNVERITDASRRDTELAIPPPSPGLRAALDFVNNEFGNNQNYSGAYSRLGRRGIDRGNNNAQILKLAESEEVRNDLDALALLFQATNLPKRNIRTLGIRQTSSHKRISELIENLIARDEEKRNRAAAAEAQARARANGGRR